MCRLWLGSYLVLAVAAVGLSGCGKADPGPAVAPAVGGAPAAKPAANVPDPAKKEVAPETPAATATTPAAAPAGEEAPTVATASSKVDLEIQEKLKAIGAKLKAAGPTSSLTRDQMKQIGLAFHHFHDVFKGFPALNGEANKDNPKNNGLSWRVALLPFLDEGPLYQEFHQDEPWDSEHNLKLVARMPAVFGKNPEGKTQLHVLTGNGAPFKMDERVGIRDVTDGTSNTIMAFVGGPDTAEIWTKPGGREFDPKDPLKSLGNVGDKFQVVFMDGAVRSIPKGIPAEQLANLAQNADGNVIGDIADTATASAAGGALKINDPVAPPAPAAPKLELNFIPDDAFAAVALHPRRIYHHPAVKAFRDMLPGNVVDAFARELPGPMSGLAPGLRGLREEVGVAEENVDEVVLILDKSLPEAMMANPFAPPPFGVVLKNSTPLDVDGILAKITKSENALSIAEHEGVALILAPAGESAQVPDPNAEQPVAESQFCMAFISDSVVLIGNDAVIRKMISARGTTAAKTGLTKQLEAIGNPLLALAIDTKPIEKPLRAILRDVPAPVSLFAPYIAGAQTVNIAWDLDAPEMLSVSLKFKTPELAQALFGMLDQQFEAGKQGYAGLRETMEKEAESKLVLPYLDQLVAETKLSNTGESIALAVPHLKNMEKLADAFKPAVEQARKAAQMTERQNHLKQIGLAMYNHHDSLGHFPALDARGDEGSKSGLSWRVHLLPFTVDADLFLKFKMDEPWDSPHNMALIKEMPRIYGANAEGKTNIHVFTGPGAPFQPGKGAKIRDITDGTSQVLMVVEAGDDTAEIWTKPTGLQFDPADPWKSLGAIKEFQGLFFDGSVRRFKDLDKDTLGKLIQHEDGMSVEIP